MLSACKLCVQECTRDARRCAYLPAEMHEWHPWTEYSKGDTGGPLGEGATLWDVCLSCYSWAWREGETLLCPVVPLPGSLVLAAGSSQSSPRLALTPHVALAWITVLSVEARFMGKSPLPAGTGKVAQGNWVTVGVASGMTSLGCTWNMPGGPPSPALTSFSSSSLRVSSGVSAPPP